MSNLTDITEMTDAALDAFLRIKGGEECVDVDDLSPAERLSICKALGINPPLYWLSSSSSTPRQNSRRGSFDYEGAILAEQDERFQD